MAVDPVSMTAGLGLGILQYQQQQKAAKFQRQFQQAMYAANLKGLRTGYVLNAQRVFADQQRASLEASVQYRQNARQAMEAMGIADISAAARGVGGRAAQESVQDLARVEAENRQAITQRRELDQDAARRSLEVAAVNTNAQILQAFPPPVQDPSLLNALIGGAQMGASFGAFG